jgi:hypothetical protein
LPEGGTGHLGGGDNTPGVSVAMEHGTLSLLIYLLNIFENGDFPLVSLGEEMVQFRIPSTEEFPHTLW